MNYIDKDYLLSKVTEKEIFIRYLGTDKFRNNISSPFSEDKKPSFKVYEKNWTYKCHTSDKQGGVFQLVQDLFNLDFKEALNKISNDFNIPNEKQKNSKKTEKFIGNGEVVKLSTAGVSFWKEFGVKKEILSKFGIKEYKTKKNELVFAIPKKNDSFGIYRPQIFNSVYSQIKSFKSVSGSKTRKDFIFGYKQLPSHSKKIIITAGEKDCMVLSALGFNAVTFGSEGIKITKTSIESLLEKTEQLLVCFDNDSTGFKAERRLSETYNIPIIQFNRKYNDLAEYLPTIDFEQFDEIITRSIDLYERKKENEVFQYLNKFYVKAKDKQQKPYSREVSNFIIKVHYFIISKTESKRVISITSDFDYTEPFTITTNDFSSLTTFKKLVESKGAFIFFGNDNDFNKIKEKIFFNVEKIKEVSKLGFDLSSNSFVFSNGAIKNNKFYKADDKGIVRFNANISDSIYIPTASKDNKKNSTLKDFIFKPGTLNTKQWFNLMISAFGKEKTVLATSLFISGLFYDLISEINGKMPLMFIHGKTQSGKTTFMKSMYSILSARDLSIGLGNTTKGAISSRPSQLINTPIWFDEYNKTIPQYIQEILKGFFDGIGREKKNYSNDNSTYSDEVLSSIVLIGETLPTMQALVNRTIIIPFTVKEKTTQSATQLNELNSKISGGNGSVLLELLTLRNTVEATFEKKYRTIENNLMKRLIGKNNQERLIKNFSIPITMYQLLVENNLIDKLYSLTELIDVSIDYIENQNYHIMETDIVQDFWELCDSLFKERKHLNGVEYRVDSKGHLCIRNLFFNTYKQHYFNIHRENPVIKDIKNNLENEDYFIGKSKTAKFKNISTDVNYEKQDSNTIKLDYSMLKELNLVPKDLDL